jgi:Periplasmic copper-binding protein (NosD)
VGIFAPAPFTANYANVVVNNDITDNGLPGVALLADAPGANLADNMIGGNRISGNGADTADTATPGPAGVNISGGDNGSGVPLAVITGTVIAGNVIRQETDGVVTKTNAVTAVHLNDFFNLQTGIDNVNGGTGIVGYVAVRPAIRSGSRRKTTATETHVDLLAVDGVREGGPQWDMIV